VEPMSPQIRHQEKVPVAASDPGTSVAASTNTTDAAAAKVAIRTCLSDAKSRRGVVLLRTFGVDGEFLSLWHGYRITSSLGGRRGVGGSHDLPHC
jgi:hypothetical protein